MTLDLTPAKALIFRITHIANVPWLLDHGLHRPTSDLRDPTFRRIRDLETKLPGGHCLTHIGGERAPST